MATKGYYANNVQDVGGLKIDTSTATGSLLDSVDDPMQSLIDKSAKPYSYWEYQCHAFYMLLLAKGLAKAGSVRRAIEQLPSQSFQAKSYYEKWAAALAAISIEMGTIKQSELEAALGLPVGTPQIEFRPGDYVRVKPEDSTSRYRRPHLRTPGYLFGVIGRVREVVGYLEEPDISAYPNADGPKQPVYRVVFSQKDVWESYSGPEEDTIDIEIWQPWLEACDASGFQHQQRHRAQTEASLLQQPEAHFLAHGHEHQAHSHEHDHVHEERAQVEQTAVDKEGTDADRSAFCQALIKLFIIKGIISAAELRERVELLESCGSNPIGPRLVARAWVDPAFRQLLLEDGMTAARELGFEAAGYPLKGGFNEETKELAGNLLVAVPDSEEEYNLIVCTLCSCYPVHILGLSPSWYKSRAYRARSVRDPRAVLREFGTAVPDHVRIVVRDSTADTRFIKIPMRPAGTEGWSEEQLRKLITRDSLVGVCFPRSPSQQ